MVSRTYSTFNWNHVLTFSTSVKKIANIYYRRCTIYVLGLKENDKVAWKMTKWMVRHVHPSVPMPVYYIEEEFTTNLKFILGKGYYPCIRFNRIRIILYKAIYIRLPYDIQC